jgi:excisionase family DNA binding protein
VVAVIPRGVLVDEGKRDEATPAVDPSSLPEVLTVEEAAQLLRLNPATVRKLVREGQLPHARVGGKYRLSKTRLMTWIAGDSPPE